MRIKKALDGLILKIPVVSPIVKKINIARSVRVFEAGSSEVVLKTLNNGCYQEAAVKVLERTKKGEKLSQAIKDYPDLFPLTVVQMIEVGEETGAMVSILNKLGNFFEAEAADALKELTIVIKLALMIIMGGVMGFFLVSLIQKP